MADTVEGLVIEIESGANEVGSQLDILISKLDALKRTVSSSTPLKTFSRNYTLMMNSIANAPDLDTTRVEKVLAFSQAMNTLSNVNSSIRTFAKNYTILSDSLNANTDFDTSKAEAIRTFAQAMMGLGSVKISPTIATQLDNLGFVMQNISAESVASLDTIITALSKLSTVSEVKISPSIANQLTRIAELGNTIKKYDFRKLTQLTSAISQLGALSNVSGDNVSKLATSVKTFSNAAKTASSRGKSFNTVLANIRTRTLALVHATRLITRVVTKAMSTYGNYVESLNLFKMAMGDAAEEAYEFAEKAQSLLGIDLTQWMQAQGVFNALAKGFGVAGDRAAIMSKNLTQLAYDISSFYNIDVDSAIEKVRSGFSGQIRPVRDLGYDLSQARLEAIALSLGIDEEVKSMTQAEKSQLRYIALMTQLTEVQGDLSRTLDSPINQMRLLNAQVEQMLRSIGMTLLPILNKVLPYLNAIFRVIRMIADEIAAMFGYTLPRISNGDWSSNISMGADELEEDLEDANGAAKELKNTLASFDQINLITSSSGGKGSGTGVSGSSALGNIELPQYDFLGDVTENKAQEIADKIMTAIRPVVDVIKGIILFVVDNIDTIVQVVETFAAVTIGKNLLGKIAGLFDFTDKEMDKFNKFVKGLELLVIGVTFSYLGGKDIGEGNVLEGFIKSALGIGTATLGGLKMAGPTGAVVGFTISVLTTIKGYFDGKAEKLKQECHDMFYAIQEDAKMLDNVVESWNKFVEEYTDPALLDKYNTADAMKKDVEGIEDAIVNLIGQYNAGSLTVGGYASALVGLYEQLETATVKHLKAVDDALIASLNGPLGVYLEARGYDVKSLIAIFQETTDDYASMLEKNRLKMQEYQHYIDEGIQVEHYKKKMEEVIAENEKIYQSMGNLEEATVTTFDSFKNIKINLENFDEFTATMDEIEKVYTDATTSIDNQLELQRKKTEQVLLDPKRTEAEKQFAKESLEIAEEYWKEQTQKVNDAYLDLIQSFENQAALNWEDVYNAEGMGVAFETLRDEMKQFDDAFDKAYGVAKTDRVKSYFSEIIDYQDQYGKAYSELWASIMENDEAHDAAKKNLKDLEDVIAEFVRNNTEHTGKLGKTLEKFTKNNKDAFVKNEDIARHYENAYGKSMSNVGDTAKKTTEIFYGETEEVAKRYMDLSYLFADEELLVDPLYGTMMTTAYTMSSPDVVGSFMGGADKLMNSVASSITGSKDELQRAYFGALEMPLQPVVDLGAGLGMALGDGIASTASYIEESTKEGTKGAAKELNRFGEGFAEFMKEISASTMSGFDAFFQVTGDNTISYNPPKIKAPRVKGYATGGFPDSADFFYANENGVPEYVGSIGSRTAVATNTDIVKGVSDGVYRAIASTGIQNDVKRIANKNGTVVFAPSEEAGKVMQQSVNMYNGTGGRY